MNSMCNFNYLRKMKQKKEQIFIYFSYTKPHHDIANVLSMSCCSCHMDERPWLGITSLLCIDGHKNRNERKSKRNTRNGREKSEGQHSNTITWIRWWKIILLELHVAQFSIICHVMPLTVLRWAKLILFDSFSIGMRNI